MHSSTYPLLIPLVILIPAIGAFINLVWGKQLGERFSSYIGIGASVLTFIISVLIFSALSATHGAGTVVNPFFFDSWIRIESVGVDIPWQFRVDTLTATMLLVVTGIGSLIHIYSKGYMHGDAKFARFFAFLNMFLLFMLILVTANNYLMMFVGWEGVGLMSYLLIGFWWDKKAPEGWKNSNAARKAMVVNRVGDFGILMSVFLMFWTFGTLNYYSAGETANVCYTLKYEGYLTSDIIHEAHPHSQDECAEIAVALAAGESLDDILHHDAEHGEDVETEGDIADEAQADDVGLVVPDDHSDAAADTHETDTHETDTHVTDDAHAEDDAHGVAAVDTHGDDAHGDDGHGGGATLEELNNRLFLKSELGVFGQVDYLMNLTEDHPERLIDFGPFSADISVVLTLIVLFMLLGVAGKSAQIPLFVWLPDAMAGPTPVSALMHAATMVTAGVFLLVRSSVFLDYAPFAQFVVAMVGSTTALVAGFIAMGQWDIKRVLAYSTISQLGFMVAAVGVGGYVAAMFHLVTHAMFKACLFLGSGSIIHGVEHGHHIAHGHHGHGHDDHGHDAHGMEDVEHGTEHPDAQHEHPFDPQDMRNMGGLWQRMPITFYTYLFGTFALAGLFPFAGFWSKDEILVYAFDKGFFGTNPLLQFGGFVVLALLLVAAFFTAFYMWRQIQMVFFGKPRTEAAARAPESVGSMTIPLIVLALLSLFGGFINVPGGGPFSPMFKAHEFGHWLEGAVPSVTLHEALYFNWPLAILATLVAAGAIYLAHRIYAGDKAVVRVDEDQTEHQPDAEHGTDPLDKEAAIKPAWRIANARMYWDQFYYMIIEGPYNRLGRFFAEILDWDFLHDYFHDRVIKRGYDAVANLLSKPLDIGLIDGVVNGVARLVSFTSGRIRTVQTGYVRTYAVALLFGVVVVIILMLLPLLQNG